MSESFKTDDADLSSIKRARHLSHQVLCFAALNVHYRNYGSCIKIICVVLLYASYYSSISFLFLVKATASTR